MMARFDAYKLDVLTAYDRKLAEGLLSPLLVHVTPGNLKEECIRVCEERFEARDEPLLRSFFGQKDGALGYRQALRSGTADPFRPLVNFLRDRSIKTDERNVELLAWLVGFEKRPYRYGYVGGVGGVGGGAGSDVTDRIRDHRNEGNGNADDEIAGSDVSGNEIANGRITENDSSGDGPAGRDITDGENIDLGLGEGMQDKADVVSEGAGKAVEETGAVDEKETGEVPEGAGDVSENEIGKDAPTLLSVTERKKFRLRVKVWAAVVVVVTLVAAWLLRKPKVVVVKGACMYWKVDRYEPVACDAWVAGVQLVAYDSVRLVRFRRILSPDTLTTASLKKVWYIKLNGAVEFYTDSGLHPIYPDRRVLPLSAHILDKYVFHR